MTKEAEQALVSACEKLAKAKEVKYNAEQEIKQLETDIKAAMKGDSVVSISVGDGWTVEIVTVAPTKTVDTARLKKAGLFDEYSKDKAGYEQVKITNPHNEFLTQLDERRKKHIEEGKK